ncbi:MAG: sulfatase [Planctomycetota bacterium]
MNQFEKLVMGCLTLCAIHCLTIQAAERPNIVLILTDDMGYADIGPFGDKYKTPNLDRMAAGGVKLADFYVSSVCCTPSRSALMTGCYAERIGMGGNVVFPADKRGLNPTEITIPKLLKKAGYATGCFGKWHLGDQPEYLPNNHGFDEFEGVPYSNDMWEEAGRKEPKKYPPLPYLKQDKVVAHIPDGASQALLTDAISDAAISFIKRHAGEPFFAYVPLTTVHAPWFATKERLAATDGDAFKAQITEIDNCVGRVLETLRALGLDKKTLVFFTNDNGGGGKTYSFPLRGGKFGPKYEGNMRMATLAWWPGKIPPGKVSTEIGTTADLLPTFAALSGVDAPNDRIIDGKDIGDLLVCKDGYHSHHHVLFYGFEGVREGNWKLIRIREKGVVTLELYDLDKDLGEKSDLAKQDPDRVKAMLAQLDAHVAEVKKNSRPAGFVQNPKPLLTDSNGTPTLAQYRH